MSIALLEAMALGIPLVASSIPGNRRLIGDFKHGRLAPPDDPEGLARVIIEQWDELRSRLPHEPRRPRPRRAGILHPDVARKHLDLFATLWTVGSEETDHAQLVTCEEM